MNYTVRRMLGFNIDLFGFADHAEKRTNGLEEYKTTLEKMTTSTCCFVWVELMQKLLMQNLKKYYLLYTTLYNPETRRWNTM